tara:strand:+ start:243 stop:443 length:201 start_codon:yes stop_codon:yes gene_type:complete
LSKSIVEELRIKNWPIWTCEPSSFDWSHDYKETFLLLEGEVTVSPDGGEHVKLGAVNLVVLPAVMN